MVTKCETQQQQRTTVLLLFECFYAYHSHRATKTFQQERPTSASFGRSSIKRSIPAAGFKYRCASSVLLCAQQPHLHHFISVASAQVKAAGRQCQLTHYTLQVRIPAQTQLTKEIQHVVYDSEIDYFAVFRRQFAKDTRMRCAYSSSVVFADGLSDIEVKKKGMR